jgi:predicted DNA-binding protein
MSKTLTLRIDDETYEEFLERAKSQNRSLANFIENAVKEHIQEEDLVDEFEMAQILADRHLIQRLKRGSRDAIQKKGKMIG